MREGKPLFGNIGNWDRIVYELLVPYNLAALIKIIHINLPKNAKT